MKVSFTQKFERSLSSFCKLTLAENMVAFYHSKQLASRERTEFIDVFSQRQLPKELPIYKVKESVIDIIDVLYSAKLVASKNEARRLLSQGGISLLDSKGGTVVTLKEQKLKVSSEGAIFKVGKKRFLKLVLH